jgi:hypothetical protein
VLEVRLRNWLLATERRLITCCGQLLGSQWACKSVRLFRGVLPAQSIFEAPSCLDNLTEEIPLLFFKEIPSVVILVPTVC